MKIIDRWIRNSRVYKELERQVRHTDIRDIVFAAVADKLAEAIRVHPILNRITDRLEALERDPDSKEEITLLVVNEVMHRLSMRTWVLDQIAKEVQSLR